LVGQRLSGVEERVEAGRVDAEVFGEENEGLEDEMDERVGLGVGVAGGGDRVDADCA